MKKIILICLFGLMFSQTDTTIDQSKTSMDIKIDLDKVKSAIEYYNVSGLNKDFSKCLIDEIEQKYGKQANISTEVLEYLNTIEPICKERFGGHDIKTKEVKSRSTTTRSLGTSDFPLVQGGWSYAEQKHLWDDCMYSTTGAYLYCECMLESAQFGWSYESARTFPVLWTWDAGLNMVVFCPELIAIGSLRMILTLFLS